MDLPYRQCRTLEKAEEERIEEWGVVSVGRKYITARSARNKIGREVRFDADNDFIQDDPNGSVDYILSLSEEDLRRDLWRDEARHKILDMMSGYQDVLARLSDQDLRIVLDIFHKYQ